ncbi:hypothetical protein GGQ22_01275 [Nocardioides sp. zg-579]|uniref:MmgE/PrpD N-terminal domain-containing protein n=1 Tax=Nocardioides marmotae TaxID=2663857 RepID=A0A6I3J468_9ACTN|nr:MmgE/PrpD family protein [Nocardioides marmotae]MCR6030073.1 hypothetical protein [Gordonia jinghuaiqii]MTB93704.1 hypothetical protein [Nocardioides marmotae]QKE00049.1 hypothetical protein HPC71_02345 [Nocardioides marmotae]
MNASTPSAAVAAFVSGKARGPIPAEVTAVGREVLTSVTGRISANTASPLATQVGATMAALGHGGKTRVPGSSETYSPYGAAFVMGVAAGRDGAQPWAGATVAAALAASSLTQAGPDRLTEGITVGLEVAARLSACLGDSHTRRGWDPAGSLGVVGAALAVARLLEAEEPQALEALAFAATQAAGLGAQSTTPTGAVHVGKAAADGLEAARLGLAHLGAPAEPIEGRRGMGALMSDALTAAALVSGLGSRWVLLESAAGGS